MKSWSPAQTDELHILTVRDMSCLLLTSLQALKEEAASRVMVRERRAPFALRGATAARLQSRAVDKPAPSGTWLLLHLRATGRSVRLTSRLHYPPVPCDCSRWRADPWSPCSDSCGGGSQTRTVRCMKGPEGRWTEVGSRYCLGTGRRPSNTRLCNQQPCARWAATHWGPVSHLTFFLLPQKAEPCFFPGYDRQELLSLSQIFLFQCHGQCVGPGLATQYRHVYCRDTNGTKVPSRMCGGLQR